MRSKLLLALCGGLLFGCAGFDNHVGIHAGPVLSHESGAALLLEAS